MEMKMPHTHKISKKARLELIAKEMAPWVEEFEFGVSDNRNNFLSRLYHCIRPLGRDFIPSELTETVTPLFKTKFPKSEPNSIENEMYDYEILASNVVDYLELNGYFDED